MGSPKITTWVVVFAPGFVHDPASRDRGADGVAGQIHRVADGAVGRQHPPSRSFRMGLGSGAARPRFLGLVDGQNRRAAGRGGDHEIAALGLGR